MNKEDLILQINKIYQALNTISVQGYNNIKTFGNCMDALQELAKNTNSYEDDIQNMIKEQIKSLTKDVPQFQTGEIVPLDTSKPKPQRIKEEVNNNGEDTGKAI